MESVEEIYTLYSKKIYNLAYRMTGNRDDAEDITHDTFLRAFEALEDFRGESHVYTWLFKIAKNRCLQLLEKKRKPTFLTLQQLSENNRSPFLEEVSENEKMNYILQVKEGCLSGLLRCLSLQQRIAFILYVLLELPIDEVANVLEKSENAARILVHRSRQNIQDFLCSNCSLYKSTNTCSCESLINFSLINGWISSKKAPVLESEIRNLKDVISAYKNLEEVTPGNALDFKIRQLIVQKDFLIFNDKKVK